MSKSGPGEGVSAGGQAGSRAAGYRGTGAQTEGGCVSKVPETDGRQLG